MSSGACGIYAMKAGDFQATEFPGTQQGLDDAITYCTALGGIIHVYPGGGSLSVPTLPANVQVYRIHEGRIQRYGRNGLIVREANVRDFGAVGDWNGSTGTDDTAAFTAAYNALGATGGTILVPAGRYLITSQLNFTKRIKMVGEGGTSDEWTAGNTEIVKAAAMATTAIVFRESHSEARDFSLSGVAGNTGDGIQIRGNTCRATNVMVIGMGGNGWRIGHSDASNTNIWYLDHCSARNNVGHGFYFHSDDTGGTVNANAGTAICCSSNQNTGNGFHLKNTYGNTFIGTHAEGNTGYGIYLDDNGATTTNMNNLFMGGDVEGNNGSTTLSPTAEVYIAGLHSFDNTFMYLGSAMSFMNGTVLKYTDLGLRTRIIERDQWTLPPVRSSGVAGEFDGAILTSTPPGGLSRSASWSPDQKQFINLSGGGVDRIQFGWKYNGPEASQYQAQVIAADPSVLWLAARNNVATSKVKIQAGTNASPTLLVVDAGAGLVDSGADVNVASGKVYKVNGTQVVSARGAAVADATGAGDVVAQLNALLARMRAHGLIAP